MSNNQQPFSPPLTAEERALWDRMMSNGYPAEACDEAIHERRRRFGVPGPTAQDLCAQELFRKVCDKSEIDTLRAQVETLAKERDELLAANRDKSSIIAECSKVNAELRARAEKAEAELAAARPVLEAVVNFAWGPYADAVLAKELLVNYSNAQRAARAAKEGGAS